MPGMSEPAERHPFFIVLLIATTLAFAALLLGFWKALFWATVLGVLFSPVQQRLAKRLGGRQSMAAVLTVLLIIVTVLLPAMLVASAVAAEAALLYSRIESGEIDLAAIPRWLSENLPAINEMGGRLGIDMAELTSKLSSVAVTGSRFIASLAISAGQNVTSFVVMFFLMLYLLFFVLRDGASLLQQLHRAIPLPDEQEKALFDKFATVSRATIKGTLVIGLLQGTLGGIMFAILGIQGAVFWGVVMVIMSVLPAIGSGLVWGPAAIYLLVTGEWLSGTVLILFGILVIGLVDNLLRPVLVGRDTRMPDYLVLLSTLGGLALFGITGFVLGPVIAALFLAVWQLYIDNPAT